MHFAGVLPVFVTAIGSLTHRAKAVTYCCRSWGARPLVLVRADWMVSLAGLARVQLKDRT